MEINWYEKTKDKPIEFEDLEAGEYFIRGKDANIWTEDVGDNVALYKKLEPQNIANAVDISDRSGNEPFATFEPKDAVYRVEIKNIIIDIEW